MLALPVSINRTLLSRSFWKYLDTTRPTRSRHCERERWDLNAERESGICRYHVAMRTRPARAIARPVVLSALLLGCLARPATGSTITWTFQGALFGSGLIAEIPNGTPVTVNWTVDPPPRQYLQSVGWQWRLPRAASHHDDLQHGWPAHVLQRWQRAVLRRKLTCPSRTAKTEIPE
jgi:hypothetical protein